MGTSSTKHPVNLSALPLSFWSVVSSFLLPKIPILSFMFRAMQFTWCRPITSRPILNSQLDGCFTWTACLEPSMFLCNRRIGNILNSATIFPICTHGHTGFSEMILITILVSTHSFCFSVAERVLWVLFEVLCGIPGFHCHLPTVLVPVVSVILSDHTHKIRFGMFRNLEILMEVLCAWCTQTLLLYYDTPYKEMSRLRLSMVSSDKQLFVLSLMWPN